MKDAVIISGARTPIGSFLGGLSSLSAPSLGSIAIESALKRAKFAAKDVDEVIMGQVLQGGVGQAPARQASLGASVPNHVPCTTINKVCGSGLKAVMLAADSIAVGSARSVIAGGMESMSNAPYILPKSRVGFRMGDQAAVDLMIHDGLYDPYGQAHMGVFGDLCASEFGFSRQEQDLYAQESYRRAIAAQKNGWFKDEIAPVTVKLKEERSIDEDEEPARFMPQKMAKLRPAFGPDGSITAANASKLSDGAAALLVMSADEARAKNLAPRARIIASASYAKDPQWFTTAPIGAIEAALKNASLSINDIDLFEINEAFSVVAMTAMKELSLPHDRINVMGGAVALGHPIGCSGARLLVTLLNALAIENKSRGLVSLCIGGGEAVAMIIELC